MEVRYFVRICVCRFVVWIQTQWHLQSSMVDPDMIKDSRDFTPILFVLNIKVTSLFNTTRSQVNNILFYIRVLKYPHEFPHGSNTNNGATAEPLLSRQIPCLPDHSSCTE